MMKSLTVVVAMCRSPCGWSDLFAVLASRANVEPGAGRGARRFCLGARSLSCDTLSTGIAIALSGQIAFSEDMESTGIRMNTFPYSADITGEPGTAHG
ncbi:hypothetical protein [Paraburkholderia silvatlantica]|uniref:Uncharacterized protein n=1 Tax=Paraburkholderia silvatlantica TaxID=321895 RepID=A0ABR6FJI4_9BURK|nr:hypothetical protein [Paraburkholderia silvatlantica]MBB2927591.1 hypothetical protein [Paraburkholderia silvatlantica]